MTWLNSMITVTRKVDGDGLFLDPVPTDACQTINGYLLKDRQRKRPREGEAPLKMQHF